MKVNHKFEGKTWMGITYAGSEVYDNPVEFALFGLARQGEQYWPKWVMCDTDKSILDLGPGNKLIPGAERLDFPEYNFEHPHMGSNYLRHGEFGQQEHQFRARLPHADDSVGGIYAVHILEHLFDPRPIIQECARVLAPGCPLNIVVPDADSLIYKQDVDHKTAFCLDTWKTLLNNGGYYDNHPPSGLHLGVNFKFAIKEGNEIIVTQLIKDQ